MNQTKVLTDQIIIHFKNHLPTLNSSLLQNCIFNNYSYRTSNDKDLYIHTLYIGHVSS